MAAFTTALYTDFLSPVTVLVNSENSLLPGSNATRVTSPNTPYLSGNNCSTSEFLTYDFGVATAIAAIVVDHVNVTGLTFRGNATNSWGAASWVQTKTISRDKKDGRYKIYFVPSGTGSPFNYRYLRIEPTGSSTTDGNAKWRVGCVLPLAAISAWGQNSGFPYTPVHGQAIDPGLRIGGGGDPSALGNRYAEIQLPAFGWDATSNAAMEGLIDDLYAQRSKPLVFYRNLSSDAEVYIAHLTGDVRGPSRAGPNALDTGSVTLREVV